MPSRKRKLLFYIFILAFLVITPITILYAQGYRFQWSWPPQWDQALQKTGMLMLETEPKGAQVYIDGEPQTSFMDGVFTDSESAPIRTPAQIKYLLPGTYKVTLKKDGYWKWEKEMEVKPGKQTKVKDISLFKKNLPLRMADTPLQEFKLSPDKERAILLQDQCLVELDTGESQCFTSPEEMSGEDKEAEWGPQGEHFLMGGYLYDIRDLDNPVPLESDQEKEVKNVRWTDASTIYYQYNGKLKEFNPQNNQSRVLLSVKERTVAQMVDDHYIHTINMEDKDSVYRVHSKDSQEMIREIKLPRSDSYRFIHSEHSLINVYNEDYHTLRLINIHSLINPIKHVIEKVKYTDWRNDQELLYTTPFELWVYNTKGDKKTLLTRISESITGVDTYTAKGYILYYTESSINVLEEEEEGKIKTTTLMELQRITSPRFDKQENTIYFNAEIGRKRGLYKLKI